MKIAIVTIAYNRINSLKRLLSSLLQANYPEENVDLIISIDKSETDTVEIFADDFIWPYGQKHVKKHAQNLGLKTHILSQGEEFKEYDALVILEDDVIVSPAFYKYVTQTCEKYHTNSDIAGISLYSFPLNYLTNLPFEPIKNEYDVYFMNTAQSWGQVWMKKQWMDFNEWYLNNSDFKISSEIPEVLFSWEKSWLKFHTRYCIENNKYFVYPYHAFSSNCGAAGTHASKGYNNFQTSMQISLLGKLKLPDKIQYGIRYDGFFENKDVYRSLGIESKECCIDLNGYRHNPSEKRFWLTTSLCPYEIVESYDLSLHPIEMNVLNKINGNDIFLYDTSKPSKGKKVTENTDFICFSLRLMTPRWIFRKLGMKTILTDFSKSLKRKLYH